MASVVQVNPPQNSMMTIEQIAEGLQNARMTAKRNAALGQQMQQQQQLFPGQLAAQQQQQALYPEQLAQAHATTQTAQFKAQNPLLGTPGAAGQYAMANHYMTNFAPGSQQYQLGQNIAHNLAVQQQLAQSTAQRNQILSQTQGLRVQPTIVKEQNAQALQALGYSAPEIAQMGTQRAANILTHRIVNPAASGYAQQVAAQQAPQTESSIIKKTMPTQQQQQLVTVNTALQSMQNQDKFIAGQGFDNYFGAGGMARLGVDKAKAAAGQPVSQQYKNYTSFNRFLPTLVNEIRRAYGGQATDQEIKLMKSLATPNLMMNNPALFKTQWEELRDSLQKQKAIISKPLALQIGSQTQQGQAALGQPEQVNIPSFNSQEDYLSWYNKQSPQVQQQVHDQLGGK